MCSSHFSRCILALLAVAAPAVTLALQACAPPAPQEDDPDSGGMIGGAGGDVNQGGAGGHDQGGHMAKDAGTADVRQQAGSGGSAAAGQGGTTQAMGGTQGGGGGAGGGSTLPPPMLDTRPIVSVSTSGYQLMVKRRDASGTISEAPFVIRGISWSPHGRGDSNDFRGNNFERFADQDFALMKAAGINTIRTYAAFPTTARAVLDKALASGIVVIMSVFIQFDNNNAVNLVNAFKDHPAVLMWLVGNEWNYNNLYSNRNWEQSAARVNEVIDSIKAADPNHPVATAYGELPTPAQIQQIRADVWGLNVYSGNSFGNRFNLWKGRSTKPFFYSEYGTDAFDNRRGVEDQDTQARTLDLLLTEIKNNLSAKDPQNPCLGGTPFEFSDEWWKSGMPNRQDNNGFALGALPPDGFANEEWWGVVDIERRPRKAYATLQHGYLTP